MDFFLTNNRSNTPHHHIINSLLVSMAAMGLTQVWNWTNTGAGVAGGAGCGSILGQNHLTPMKSHALEGSRLENFLLWWSQ